MRATALILTLTIALAGCAPRQPEPIPEPTAAAATPSPSATAAALPAQAGAILPSRFTALGTEPFWSAEVDGAILVYKTPENQAGTNVAITRQVLGETTLISGTLGGTLGGKPLILSVRTARCSDGMSDREYPFAVARAIAGEVAQGCAKLD
jgi:uncharacterized membrane protein